VAEAKDKRKVSAPQPPRVVRVQSVPHAAPTQVSPRMARAQSTTVRLAHKDRVVNASVARATPPLRVCRVTTSSTNPLRTTMKTISNPAPTRIWARKVV
jgi:hypothetical protein